MKHTIFYIASRFLIATFAVFALATALSSCEQGTRYPAQLSLADSLMYARPDSSLAILTAYKDSVKTAPDATRMYFDLLLTTAQDKNYLSHTSDSTALRLVSYYEKHGPQALLSRAYYIAGRVYDDLQNAPTALEYYLKSIDATPQDSNYRQLTLVYEQIGAIYMDRDLQQESITAYQTAYKYASCMKDSLLLPFVFRDLGYAYTMRNNVDSTLYYYEKAFAMGDSAFKVDAVVNDLASIYIQIEDYKNARRILSYNPKSYALWAFYYDSMGKADSAKTFFEQSININNTFTKEHSCRKLAEYAEKEGNWPLAFSYLEKSNQYRDSISEKSRTAEIKRIEALYNYEKIKAERDKLSYEKSVQRYINILLVVIIVLLVGSFSVIYNKYKRKQLLQQDQKQRIGYLEAMIHTTAPQKENLELCTYIVNNCSSNDFKLLEKQWKNLHQEINILYPDFIYRIRTLYPRITGIELTVCCLLKLGIRNADIARILSHSANGISSLRKRLYEKINGEPGTAHQLNIFIDNL